MTADEARAELRELTHSFEYAYAMGHGCSIDGAHPRFVAIRNRAQDLRAVIREHDDIGGADSRL